MDLPIYPRSSFGPSEPDLCFGLVWRGLGVALGTPFLLGLASGIVSPFLYPHQLPPSPCVRIAWARAVDLLATVAISACLLGNGLINA